jgi:hypothetical protein
MHEEGTTPTPLTLGADTSSRLNIPLPTTLLANGEIGNVLEKLRMLEKIELQAELAALFEAISE